MMKRGQSALEYLVTYGWAILAIVIVAVILWYTGIFNPGKWAASKQCGGFASITCIDYNTTGTTGATVVFGNAAGSQIVMTAPTCVGSVTGTTTVGINDRATCTFTGLPAFASGDQVSLTVTYTANGIAHSETGFVKAV